MYNFLNKKVIETEQIFPQLQEEANNSKFPESYFPVFSMRERERVGVKFPKLQIEKFSEDSKRYFTFRGTLNLVAIDNNELSNVEKFTSLPNSNKLSITSSNYKVAIKLLEMRFGSTQVIINSHMETLYKLPLIENSGDIKNMREFHNIIEMNFRNLEAIQMEPESYGCY